MYNSKNLIKLAAILACLILATACSSTQSPQNKSPSSTSQLSTQLTSQFTPEQIEQLKSIGIKIAVPAYVPDGFRVYKVEAWKDDEGWGPSYLITYRGPDNACFFIDASSGGIGDFIPEDPNDPGIPINSPIFGRARLYTKPFGSDWLSETPGEAPVYSFSTSMGTERTPSNCKRANLIDLSPPEAVKIVESLQYLDF